MLEVVDLSKSFGSRVSILPMRQSAQKAVDDVSLSIGTSETLGLIGQSGSGKTTVGRIIAGLESPDTGSLRFEGSPLNAHRRSATERSKIQVVFQNPHASMNPMKRIDHIVTEPQVRLQGLPRRDIAQRASQLLGEVGLSPSYLGKYPNELSGGQAQRVAIARALSVRPRLLICDEAVSALDVSVQAQVLNLLQRLKRRYSMGLLFISHDLQVVRLIADRVAVMQQGKIMEIGDSAEVYAHPKSAYTRELLDATLHIS